MAPAQLNIDELASFLATTYQLLDHPQVAHIRDGQGQSRIFHVQMATETMILRLYGPQPAHTPAWIEAEADWLVFLERKGCSVAAPRPLPDGTFVATLPGSDPPQYACLFTFAEGVPRWPPNPAESQQLGAALAQLHLASDGFRSTSPTRVYDLETLVYAPLSSMLPFVPEHDDRAYLQQLATQIAQTFSSIPQRAPLYGMIHGDVHQGNAHFAPGGTLMLFDFTLCGYGWRIYDFTGFLWPLRDDSIQDPGVRAACDHFVAGYTAVRPLDDAEIAAIPACVKARDLWETADWIASDPEVRPEVLQDWMRTLIARFRQTPLSPHSG